MTNTTNIYKFASWKNSCPAHESWNNIIKSVGLSAKMSVRECLTALKTFLHVNAVEINMRNNKFVDKIVSDKPEKEFKVMLPESKLEDFINDNEELRKLSYRTLFHKSFYENIDYDFPYQNLSLQQIGIPLFDVIQVSTDKGMYYVELSGDTHIFQ